MQHQRWRSAGRQRSRTATRGAHAPRTPAVSPQCARGDTALPCTSASGQHDPPRAVQRRHPDAWRPCWAESRPRPSPIALMGSYRSLISKTVRHISHLLFPGTSQGCSWGTLLPLLVLVIAPVPYPRTARRGRRAPGMPPPADRGLRCVLATISRAVLPMMQSEDADRWRYCRGIAGWTARGGISASSTCQKHKLSERTFAAPNHETLAALARIRIE